MEAKGPFQVDLKPLDSYASGVEGTNLGRMSIDKTFTGDLDAVSQGAMLSAMTSVKGSAGYVAIEQVQGTLAGKKGTFVLQHFATMAGGEQRQIIEVVPDSGTGELVGLSGEMEIIIEEGGHFYAFNYTLD